MVNDIALSTGEAPFCCNVLPFDLGIIQLLATPEVSCVGMSWPAFAFLLIHVTFGRTTGRQNRSFQFPRALQHR